MARAAPSSALLAVTARATAFTADGACPIATPQPPACSMGISLLLSPSAMISCRGISSCRASAITPLAFEQCGSITVISAQPYVPRLIGHAPYLLGIDAEVRLQPEIILVRGACPYLFLQAGIGMNHRLQAVPHEQFYRLLRHLALHRVCLQDLSLGIPRNHRPVAHDQRTFKLQLPGNLHGIAVAPRRRQRHHYTLLPRRLYRRPRALCNSAFGIEQRTINIYYNHLDVICRSYFHMYTLNSSIKACFKRTCQFLINRKVPPCHAERSEASRCRSRQTLRGVYP